jgi:hypothetical protein
MRLGVYKNNHRVAFGNHQLVLQARVGSSPKRDNLTSKYGTTVWVPKTILNPLPTKTIGMGVGIGGNQDND